jgi:hypothetical protein
MVASFGESASRGSLVIPVTSDTKFTGKYVKTQRRRDAEMQRYKDAKRAIGVYRCSSVVEVIIRTWCDA